MKTILLICCFGLAAALAPAAPFVNLDFESAKPENGNRIRDLMPGWLLNGSSDNGMNYNGDCDEFCGAFISRAGLATGDLYLTTYFPNGLHGNYGLGLAPKPDFPLTLSQRGDVPAEAKYLYLDAQVSQGAYVLVYLDTSRVTEQFVNGAFYTDISAFAGKTVNLELRFYSNQVTPAIAPAIGVPPAVVGLDAVVFLVPPKLETASPSLGTNGFTLSWTNDVSTRYQVEFTTNFPAKWQPIGASVSSTNGNFTFTDTNATAQTAGQRFYRLRLAP